MSVEKIIRAEARNTLKSGYVSAIMGFVLMLLLFMFFEAIAQADGLIYITLDEIFDKDIFFSAVLYYVIKAILTLIPCVVFLLLSPFINGYIKLYYDASLQNKYDVENLAYFFHKGKYKKTIKLNFSYFLRMIIPTIIFSLPILAFVIICSLCSDNYNEQGWYYFFFGVFVFLSTVGLLIYSLKYFVVFTKYSVDESLNIKEYFKYSKRIMSGKTVEIIKLTVSFIPWFLLSLLAVPLIYVVPYYTQALCISAKWLCELEKEENNYEETQSIPLFNSIQ